MHDTAHFSGTLLLHDAQSILRRFTGVDNEWFTAFLRRPDVDSEALALPVEWFLQTIIIESGLADGDHLRMIGQAQQFFDCGFVVVDLFIRMHAGTGKDISMTLGHTPNSDESGEGRANCECVSDIVAAHPC